MSVLSNTLLIFAPTEPTLCFLFQPKRWPAFWKDTGSSDVLALDMVENENDLRRILAAITVPHKVAPTRCRCMQCNAILRTRSRSVHCRHCSRITCGACLSSCLPPEYFLKSFKVSEPSWACTVCEKILTARKEVMSNGTHPTSSYGEDDDDRCSC